jgi:lactose/L-arabinose transport system permease protein
MMISATNKSIDVVRGTLVPGTYFFDNFNNLLKAHNVAEALTNSCKYSLLLTLISLIICSLAGYGFEIFHDKVKDFTFSILLLAMMVPFAATMIPLFQMFSKADLLNTTLGFILPTISTPFMIMLFRQSARSFPA